MKRKEIICSIKEQVKRIQETGLMDAINQEDEKEAEKRLKSANLDFSALKDFLATEKNLCLEGTEIPKEFCELVFYINLSGISDNQFFEEPMEFEHMLKMTRNPKAWAYAKMMSKKNLCDYSFLDLIHWRQ